MERTDINLSANNFPFIKLTESKMSNVWYHETHDGIFTLTADGFKRMWRSNKRGLIREGLVWEKY